MIDRWLGAARSVDVVDEASVSAAREFVREEAARVGLPTDRAAALATVASELGHNHLAHARHGRLGVLCLERDGVPGVEVVAVDRGAGLVDPRRALRGAGESEKGLGIGLAGVLEHADEVDFDVRIGEGTCVRARKFARAVPRRHEVGIYGRPYPGERVSGDDATFVRTPRGLVVAVIDGLGHGPDARAAAAAAVETILAHPDAAPGDAVVLCHAALANTRGAVMGIARLAPDEHTLEGAVVGNVALCVRSPRASQLFGGPSFVVGARGQALRPRPEHATLGSFDAVVLSSDGLRSQANREPEPELFRERPIVIAQTLVERYARENDDVLVLVAR